MSSSTESQMPKSCWTFWGSCTGWRRRWRCPWRRGRRGPGRKTPRSSGDSTTATTGWPRPQTGGGCCCWNCCRKHCWRSCVCAAAERAPAGGWARSDPCAPAGGTGKTDGAAYSCRGAARLRYGAPTPFDFLGSGRTRQGESVIWNAQ